MMSSPSPVREDNLRRLLDQRAARVDVYHTRFPSLTEFSDSPSIYSHPHFSPRPPHLDSSPPQFDFAIPPQYARPSFDAVRSLASSTTDTHGLDTDSIGPTSDRHPERTPSPHPEDEEPEPRMSFLGPTMRFHSPAPWETEDTIKEGAEQDDDARSFVTKRNRSKTRGDGFMKTFGRNAPPKATSVVRPSFESSNGREKVSLDSQIGAHTNSHAQPQVPASATQPATSSSRPSRPGLIFSRGRSRTVSHTAVPDTSIPPPPPPPVSPGSVPGSTYPSSPGPTRSTSPNPSMYSSILSPTDVTDGSRPTSPLSFRGRPDFVHPYANPDLAYDAGPVHTASSFHPSSSLRRMVVPSDSIATVSVSESGVSQSSSILTPDSSISSIADYHADVLLKKVVNNVQGKAISNPLPAMSGQGQKPGSQPTTQDKGSRALPNHVPGWTELTVSPTFNLISLQEAQAQARERSRTHTQVTNDSHFLQTEPPRNTPIALSGATGRLRSRTASAGSKTKAEPAISNPIPHLPSGSDDFQVAPIHPTGSLPRTLKQKKSGFMRLFNGKDRDKPTTPSSTPVPPVPAPSIPRTPKLSSARVPVPSLSPSLISQSPFQLDDIVKGDGGENDSADDLRGQGSIKRHVPALSICTQDSPPTGRPNGTQSARPTVESTPLVSGINLGLSPASAPPSTTAFPGLSLRPMSTLFSAHFADHIVSVDSPPTASSDTPTIGSSRSTLNSADERRPAAENDPYVIIQQLQEQMKATRKAWQHQIWELEGQVRDLRAEIDDLRFKELRGERCLLCGRSDEQDEDVVAEAPRSTEPRPGVVDRPRARTGVGTRFGAAT